MIARRFARCASAVLAVAGLLAAFPASARDFVSDQAGMFSAGTVAQLNQQISNFNAQTGKEVVVMTVGSLSGQTVQAAAQAAFASQNVNGVLIYISKGDRKDIIVPGVSEARAGWFTPEVTRSIGMQMESQFKTENFDAGISGAVENVLAIYRQHVGALHAGGATAYAGGGTSAAARSFGGFHLNMFWWIVIFVVGFLILRSIIRSLSGPRYYGGGPMQPGGMPGGVGFGGPGYYGGGGGGFWSGMLGGLGGAWLGNELFGQHGNTMVDPMTGALNQGNWNSGGIDPNAGGWQNDAGQADMGAAGSGDWSGGGFGGDSGGGFGGGDSGGGFGGGDSGGGW